MALIIGITQLLLKALNLNPEGLYTIFRGFHTGYTYTGFLGRFSV